MRRAAFIARSGSKNTGLRKSSAMPSNAPNNANPFPSPLRGERGYSTTRIPAKVWCLKMNSVGAKLEFEFAARVSFLKRCSIARGDEDNALPGSQPVVEWFRDVVEGILG